MRQRKRGHFDPVSLQVRREAQVRKAIAEALRVAGELERDIEQTERTTRNSDPTHFAYSPFAKAQRLRRDNLLRSVAEFRASLPATDVVEVVGVVGTASSVG